MCTFWEEHECGNHNSGKQSKQQEEHREGSQIKRVTIFFLKINNRLLRICHYLQYLFSSIPLRCLCYHRLRQFALQNRTVSIGAQWSCNDEIVWPQFKRSVAVYKGSYLSSDFKKKVLETCKRFTPCESAFCLLARILETVQTWKMNLLHSKPHCLVMLIVLQKILW